MSAGHGLFPEGLGPRGMALWQDVSGGGPVEGPRAVLLAEACRIADRLERLDRMLRGDVDTWMSFELDEGSGEMVLRISGALSESRQQVNVLRQVLAQVMSEAPDSTGEVSLSDELERRRRERSAGTAG